MLRHYVALARPKEWVKNIFVLLPAPFAIADGARPDPLTFALGLFGFCLASSAVYAFNDAQDAERDKVHAVKRNRPVAAGAISVTGARLWGVALIAASLALVWASGSRGALIVTLAYLAANAVYSFGAKHVPLVDVFLLASFYLLRVLLGCALLEVAASNWLLLCTYAVSLFIGFAKRRSDFLKGLDSTHRPALGGYDRGFLDQAMGIAAAMTIVAYALYSMEAPVLIEGRQFAALPFVVFIVLDYLRAVHVRGAGGSPVEMVLKSPALLLSFAGWLLATLWSVRWG